MALGASGEVLNMHVNMQLRFVHNKLLVSEAWQEHDDVGETVAYNNTTLLGALAVGLDALVALIRGSAHCSDYYLQGFTKLTEVKDMLAITVFPGYVVN
eukprot:5197358-Amphidinium_carterae.1